MSRRFVLVALFALAASPACRAQSFGQCWGADETGTTAQANIGVTVSPSGGAGHVLVALGRSGGAPSGITISDGSGSNTWNNAGAFQSNTALGGAQAAYVNNPAAGTYTVTSTPNATEGHQSVTVCEYSGLVSASPMDIAAVANCSDTSNSCTTGSFDTSGEDLVIYLMTIGSTTGTFSAGGIGANTAALRTPSANDTGVEDTTFTAAQTNITATMSDNVAPSGSIGYAIAFKAAASPSGAPPGYSISPVGTY